MVHDERGSICYRPLLMHWGGSASMAADLRCGAALAAAPALVVAAAAAPPQPPLHLSLRLSAAGSWCMHTTPAGRQAGCIIIWRWPIVFRTSRSEHRSVPYVLWRRQTLLILPHHEGGRWWACLGLGLCLLVPLHLLLLPARGRLLPLRKLHKRGDTSNPSVDNANGAASGSLLPSVEPCSPPAVTSPAHHNSTNSQICNEQFTVMAVQMQSILNNKSSAGKWPIQCCFVF